MSVTKKIKEGRRMKEVSYGIPFGQGRSLLGKERVLTPTEPNFSLKEDVLIVGEEATSNLSQNNNSQLNPEEIPPHIQPVTYKNNGEPIYLARGVIVQEDGALILTTICYQSIL